MANRLKQDKHRKHCSSDIIIDLHDTEAAQKTTKQPMKALQQISSQFFHGAFLQLGCFLQAHDIKKQKMEPVL